jgi:cytochrome c oxidase cbb3-type subunit 2
VNKLVLIVGGSTLVYACLALMMGVLPGIELSRVPAGAGVEPLNALEAEGREVYVANGCGYCHTQQVRPLDEDKVFGRPSAASDFKFQTPELLGSERTGPDLTNIGVRQPSSLWQYIHLYNPRAVVPESIMPSFSWLFDVVEQAPKGAAPIPLPKAYAPAYGVVVPTHEAEALIAYLAALKQPPWSGSEAAGEEVATAGTAMAGTAMSMSNPNSKSPVGAASVGAASPAGGYDQARGASLYTANCSACHQASGEGLPGAFPPLKGNDVVNDDDVKQHIHVVLHGLQATQIGGVAYGGVMPPFAATLNDADIAAILDYERTSWGNHGKSVTAAEVAAERAK